MPVSNHYTPYLVLSRQKIADIRDKQIDPQHFLAGEHKSGINDDDVILIFHHHHVLANFTQPAEGDNS